ncbi:TolC family protein [Cesiribacter sp. SM1]|uniref:TolC family protein n=1 Tax=Cesiribacter sp. SM1 TaxID=2861196 RepID=UPI001CD481BA|nr:TolC family protein [Cesiribacter sp. SM1]
MSTFSALIRGLLLLFFSAITFIAQSQTAAAREEPLRQYIREGLQSNITLQQKHIGLEKATHALKIAGSYFIPAVSFNAGYTHGSGGRAIDLPIGDMLNPVYSTLNQLTETNNFPQVENVKQSFFPQNYYDAHLRTAVPLLNTDLYNNRRLQHDKVLLQEWEVKAYERELVKDIKLAYYNYLSALEAVKIWQSALALVEQNLEVNESLLRNGKGLPAAVLRAQSELEGVKAQLQEAESNIQNAQRYFNFLLNKPQTSAIEVVQNVEEAVGTVPLLLSQTEATVAHREELQIIQAGERLNQTAVQMKQQNWVPKVNAFLDLGAQADNMNYNSQARYYLLGVSLDVPLFSGFRNRYETRQALLDVKASQLSFEQASQQMQMAAAVAQNNLATAYRNYTAAQQRLQAAQGYFKLLERGYKEGTNSLIEFIDARNQLTTSQLQLTLTTYKVLSALAQYERETSAQPINH